MLDPETGRFLTEDPKGFEAGVNFYIYADDNPINFNDPYGLDVYVAGRPVVDVFGTYYHTATVLMPNNPSDFTNRTGWMNYGNNGQIYSTMSAFPSNGVGAATIMGQSTLIYKPNNPSDNPQNFTVFTKVPTPEGMTDTKHINALINAAGQYDNTAQYNALPETEGGYNCNSFTAGIHQTATGSTPYLDYMKDNALGVSNIPGYSTPVSIGSYGVSGSWASNGNNPAAGGYLIYPNKPNTNMMREVYGK